MYCTKLRRYNNTTLLKRTKLHLVVAYRDTTGVNIKPLQTCNTIIT